MRANVLSSSTTSSTRLAAAQLVAVVLDTRRVDADRGASRTGASVRATGAPGPAARGCDLRSCAGAVSVNVLPCPGALDKFDVAADPAREFARDRKPQPGAAEFAADRAVRLLKRLEHAGVLVGRNRRCRCLRPRSFTLPIAPASMRSETEPAAVNLNALASRFLTICSSRRRSEVIVSRPSASTLTSKAKPLSPARCGSKAAAHGRRRSRLERERLGLQVDLPGLDLGEIEDVVDEGQQIVAAES